MEERDRKFKVKIIFDLETTKEGGGKLFWGYPDGDYVLEKFLKRAFSKMSLEIGEDVTISGTKLL